MVWIHNSVILMLMAIKIMLLHAMGSPVNTLSVADATGGTLNEARIKGWLQKELRTRDEKSRNC
jgi:hypothetical protein